MARTKISTGFLMYRFKTLKPEFFLVHPGGPFWSNKDAGAWSIPKGEINDNENPLLAAKREFEEETGIEPSGDFAELPPQKLRSGKLVMAWAFEGDCDPKKIESNKFSLEWPPHSGKFQEFPEIDKADWFNFETAKEKINPGQVGFLEAALKLFGG